MTLISEPDAPRVHRQRSPGNPWVTVLQGTIPFLALILLWWVLSVLELDALKYAVPPLDKTAEALWRDLVTSPLWGQVGFTVSEFVIASILAVVIGVVIGVPLGLFQSLERTFYPFIVFVQAIPKLALAPLFIVIFGFGMESKIAIGALVAFFPIMVGAIEGVRASRSEELELMKSLTASELQIMTKLRVYRALPAMFSGFQVGAVLCLVSVVVAEFLGGSSGIGYVIQYRSSTLDIPGVFSALIILSVVGVLVALLLSAASNRLTRWEG